MDAARPVMGYSGGMNPRTKEIRLRNAAIRQGLNLRKSRTRDPRALGYGKWTLTRRAVPGLPEWTPGEPVYGHPLGATLDEIENYLLHDNRPGTP